MGSCFSQEIGNKLEELKFDVLQNPNGILYDPSGIVDALFSYIESKIYSEQNLFELNGIWHSWKHHSSFSGIDKKETLEKINRSQLQAHRFLKEAKYLIITLGTSFAYELIETSENVANCHKAPAGIFKKKLLSTDKIIADLGNAIAALKTYNPGLTIIFTVSPVKHVKDGVIENNRGKARLIDAVHSLVEAHPQTFYFPSYELVTDVLRDYRFYKSDLVHPNESASSFVFEKFCAAFLDEESQLLLERIKKIIAAVNHKPFFNESVAHQKFIATQLVHINNIELSHPFINLSKEKKYFKDLMLP